MACTHNVLAGNSTDLISQLNNALATAGEDVLCLGGGTYQLNIQYSGDNNAGWNGLPIIDSEITIIGNGSTIDRVTNADQFRFFTVTETGTLRLYDLTLTNGYGTGGYGSGGAIYSEGDLFLYDATLSDNEARNGGAIYPYLGSATIENSEFTRNTAMWGWCNSKWSYYDWT